MKTVRSRQSFFVMASFKTMQDLLFLSHRSNFIDDEEFLVLSDLLEWKNPCFSYEDYSPFNLDVMSVFQSSDFGKETLPYSQMFLAFQRPYGVDLLVTAWRVFAWFEEVFGSVEQIMYLTYHSRESLFHCA